ncbi:xyloglucan endotransglucosylase/hydrolase protein 3-like [Salvia miltiorrhiza]|uniref:xyloglucan endotransglucosylase/hydrolase protein 3-like n=1 Tax=Salvia miltiorrhiza TaxID=226208 RepID=UPI0025AB9935|nr:xyloglucan endotransglucosylase/hydrolase protein 3-like [Salvia miltiorrhiza]
MAIRIAIILVFISVFLMQEILAQNSFDKYYDPLWGLNHITVDPQGTEVQLLMDQSSGAGFRSKLEYGSGLFHIRMKIPEKRTGGIVTTFYLTSAPDNQPPNNHFEIDYEFIGTNGTVQTNVYNNDEGHREQSFNLWFNPSQDFHTYEILWNSRQIVFLVDSIPIRVFKNNTAQGIDYPWKPMHIEASIWNANWAGDVDWTQAPFVAHFEDFGFKACEANAGDCSRDSYWEFDDEQKRKMQQFRRSSMTYDYCSQPSTSKPECAFNI